MQKPKFVAPALPINRLFRNHKGQVKLKPLQRTHQKLSRNAICPCGQVPRRKFKHCCGAKVKTMHRGEG